VDFSPPSLAPTSEPDPPVYRTGGVVARKALERLLVWSGARYASFAVSID
jgi:hypothetical protein